MYGLPNRAVEKIKGVFLAHDAVEKAILYGSRAKGTYKNGSDIDLTLSGNIAFQELLRIETELDDLLLPWMIDLSLYDHIDNPALIEHIQRVGMVFFQKINHQTRPTLVLTGRNAAAANVCLPENKGIF
jgi:predicted nucleotidyltransferase